MTAKVCDAWGQISISKTDVLTEGTASQIEKNNVGREALGCKYEPPVKSQKTEKPAAKTS